MTERIRSGVNSEMSEAVNLGSHKELIVWMTMLIYMLSGFAFINSGHCCSEHSHMDGEAQEDHHLPVQPCSEEIALSELTSVPGDFSLSQKHCCGQGLHSEGNGIALHVVNCQSPTEPSPLSTWLSSFAALRHGQHESPHVFSGAGCAVCRASARSPTLASILTVSLLI